ncbi:MAG TPA: protein-disulfide reductase DsbD domain-containing protein [Chitinophagaceae bacterium]|jgi:DsbC/DsbD-like thiol-disulfide interchange protein|nr:protein-disulfide reductase DsbD domain-containing protein [Chitinophagaceae bacterium]
MICLRLIFLLVPFVASAQHADIVTVTARKLVVKAGDIKNLKIGIKIKEGFHIQANKLEDKALVPTTLIIDTTDGIVPGKNKYPRAKKYKLEGTESFLDVYDGYVEIMVPLRATKEIKPGLYQLNAVLHYQACDAKRCFFPRSLALIISIEVMN